MTRWQRFKCFIGFHDKSVWGKPGFGGVYHYQWRHCLICNKVFERFF